MQGTNETNKIALIKYKIESNKRDYKWDCVSRSVGWMRVGANLIDIEMM